jgi:hypothetical protein
LIVTGNDVFVDFQSHAAWRENQFGPDGGFLHLTSNEGLGINEKASNTNT